MPKNSLLIVFCLIFVIIYSFTLDSYNVKKKEIDFLPRSDFAAAVSGTFNNFISDIFFVRSIFLIGDMKNYFRNKRGFILKNLSLSSNLDPDFLAPIFFGGVVLSQTEDDVQKCVDFLEEAYKRNKTAWQIPYWIGFNYYYMMNNYLEAVKYFNIASKKPKAPKFLTSNQPSLYYKAGKAGLGLEFLEGLKESMEKKGEVEEWIGKKIVWLKNIVYLEEKTREFKNIYSDYPNDIQELVNKGLITKIPEDPFGNGYYWDNESKLIKSRFWQVKFSDEPNACSTCAK